MKIDLHVHCMERSGCGRSSEEDQVIAAIECGLDAIVFTDHDLLMPSEHLARLNCKYAPFQVFGGIEVSVEGEHVLVLGIQDKRLETETWGYPELHAFVRQHRGYLALAHPFRYRDSINIDVEALPPDALELSTINTPLSVADDIRALARRLDVALLANSDSHITDTLGRHYNVLDHAVTTDTELVQALKARAFRYHRPKG